jgi:hypothetical protein|tara:strand:+ start:4583 stop:5029 length:447 start_codon:yes stop_codon:yes gene_type:complete
MTKLSKKSKRKPPEKYIAKDVYDYWGECYSNYALTDYNPRGFIGHELQQLKEALALYDIYAVLLAVESGVLNGETSLVYFLSRLDEYIPSTEYPKLHYWIRQQGEAEQKSVLLDLTLLESRWIPDPMDNRRKQELAESLNSWVEKVTL